MVDIIQPLDFLGRMGGMANMPNLIGDAAGLTAQRDQQAATIDALRARAMNEQAQAAQQVEQQQKAMAYQQALQSHFAAPTPQSAANLTLQFPEYAQQIKQAYDLEDAAKRDGDVTLKSEVYSRLHNGNPEAAAGVLERYIAADKAAGGDTSDEEALLADIKSGDPARVGRATGIFGYDLATIVGPEKWAAFHGGKVVNGALVDNTGKALYEAPTKGGYQLVDVVDEYGVPTGQKRSVRTDVGDVGAAPAGAAPAGAPATGSRAARNNNPGNLEASDWTKAQPGYVGTDGRFAIFDTPANGAAAMTGLLADNYLAKGVNTIGGIISKYAPASDGNNVNAYVSAVSKATGIPAGAVLTPEQLPAVQAAMAQVEGGGPAGASAAPSGGPSQVQLAKRYGNAPAGYAWNADGTQHYIKGGSADPSVSRGGTRPIPPAAMTGYLGNQAGLGKIDQAIAALKAYPDAVGFRNGMTPNAILSRTDPQGVKARAKLASIASQKFHDISGAAVTASEAERLKPYLPVVSDSYETALAKLENLKAEYEMIQSQIATAYSPEQGYKALPAYKGATAPARPVAAPAPAPAAPAVASGGGWSVRVKGGN